MGWVSFMCLANSDFEQRSAFGHGDTSTHSENIHTIKCEHFFFNLGKKKY